ncbi:MAG: DNA repair exonuclease [Planctomycetota bacterium]|nr:DNA repair exonuclease [Planctomycetota bacterium]
MFKFLHAADLHLDSPLRGLDRYEGAPVEQIRGATRRALENMVATAIEQRVSFVIVAGDVYDGNWQDFNTGLFFVKQMSRLREAGIPVILISGNHDADSKMTRSLKLPDNVRTLATDRPQTLDGKDLGYGLEQLDVVFHGQGFRSGAVDENVVLNYPAARRGAFNIGVLHTSLDMEAGGEHARYAPCAIADLLAKQYDYWALGHIHKRRVAHEDPLIVFPGNLQGRHIRETGEKGCVLVTVDTRGRPTWEFQPLDVLRWHELKVSADDAATADEVLERCDLELRRLVRDQGGLPLAVRVLVTGNCPAHRELAAAPDVWTNQIRARALELGGGDVWIEKVKFQTAGPTAAEQVAWEGPVQEIVSYCEELRRSDELLATLGAELAALSRKLPANLREDSLPGQEPLRLDDPAYLRQAVSDVEPLLLARLWTREGGR